MKKDSNKKYHYTYYSYQEWGTGYFGSRSCDCLPEEDVNYFGSFRDKTFKPTYKIILKSDYLTRDEAIIDEIILHNFYEVDKNPHFANRSKQKTTGFFYSAYGTTFSEEHKKKIGEALKGKKHSEEHKRKNSLSKKGKVHSEESKRKMSESKKGINHPFYGKVGPTFGKTHSEETKQKISESLKGRTFSEETIQKFKDCNAGEKNPMYGKTHSEETIKKLREINSGKNHHMFGKNLPEETKRKLSLVKSGEKNPMYGRTQSEETKQKISKKLLGKVKGKKWWNDGHKEVRMHICPGTNWNPGRIKKQKEA
jgi:hypothetical protein